MVQTLALGIDVGTSGVRIAALDSNLETVAFSNTPMKSSNAELNKPKVWLDAFRNSLREILGQIETRPIGAICIDATSGTVLAMDSRNNPVGDALMYNFAVPDPEIPRVISSIAPVESAAHGPASALSRSIFLSRRPGMVRIVHQADWIAEQLADKPVPSDESNALKTGYDPIARKWPDWIDDCGVKRTFFPEVFPTGTFIAKTSRVFGLPAEIPIVAGLTDGCASFLATGSTNVGEGVTALGTTMTLKLLSKQPIFSPEFGIYSHRISDFWLAGGASNTGGSALAAHFSAKEINELSKLIDTNKSSGLEYYPLTKPGERFPINDSKLEPKISPRPKEPEQFLHGLLEGIARIENSGYLKLEQLGGPKLTSIRTVGGGANNETLTGIRIKFLKVPTEPVASVEAAAGAARVAWKYLELTN